MEQDILMIDIPLYKVEYGEEKYGYTSLKGRENLKKVLYRTSGNYCMYCYNRIKIDGNEYGHLEHAIEKAISKDKLTECIPNIGIACPMCNDKYKKIGEKGRRPEEAAIQIFEKNVKCTKENCKKPCQAYLELKKSYLKRKSARFLMQPLGVTGKDIGCDGNRKLKMQYDIVEAKYLPSKKEEYSTKEKEFIEHHIDMFHLNTVERKSTQLIKFLKDVIQQEGNYTRLEYNNQVVELFVKQVLKDKTSEEILKICKKLYTYAVLKFNT